MRPAQADGSAPLADAELESLFAPLAGARLIALAVSGGPDSLALLDGIDRWRRSPRRPAAVVLTVDHGLRPGSGREARAVAAIARKRGMDARVLTWRGPHPKSGIEGAAREARYRLLVQAAVKAGATHLVTAHHADDQAETFLMRLARGAGVSGLAAMRPAVSAGPVTLVRPFLDVPRSRLVATVASAGLQSIDDPMNADPRFQRTRVRRLMPRLASAGLDAARFGRIARRMAEAASLLDAEASALIAATVTTDPLGIAWLDPLGFAAAPSDVRLRTLVRVLLAVGGDDYAPRFDRLSAVSEAIRAYDGSVRLKRTLSGVVIEGRGLRVMFYRELGRAGLPGLRLKAGLVAEWDRRFAVAAADDVPRGMSVTALGEEGRRSLGERPSGVPAGAVAALPALRRRGALIAVPALGWGDPRVLDAVTLTPRVAVRLRDPPLFPDLLPGPGRTHLAKKEA